MKFVFVSECGHYLGGLKTIERFPQYMFSETGKVVSHIRKKPRVLKPIRMGNYLGLQLVSIDGQKKEYLHRLIAEAFHGPCPDGMICCHINGKAHDNRAENLRWDTPRANNLDRNIHGTAPVGERNPMARLTQDAVLRMRQKRAATGESYSAIAKEFNVSTMTAYRAITGQAWS